MDKEEKMEELFEKLPWLRKEYEIEREIIEKQVKAEVVYKKVLQEIEWFKHLS